MKSKLLKGVGIVFGVFVAMMVLVWIVGDDTDVDKINDANEKEALKTTEAVMETEEPTEEVVETEVAEVETEVATEESTEDQPWLQESGDYGEDVDYETSASTGSGTCNHIAALDTSDIPLNLHVSNTGDLSVEEVYDQVNYELETWSYGVSDYSDSFVRDLTSIGLPMNFSGYVSLVDNDYNYIIVGDGNGVYTVVDLSYLNPDMVIFEHDNVSFTGIYLGLNFDSKPVFLATEVNVN